MKKFVFFLVVMGCLLSSVLAYWPGYHYYMDRYGRFPHYWAQPRPFPVLYAPMGLPGSYVEPLPGDFFPWEYYPDYYARQFYDLDKGEVLIKGNAFLPSIVRVNVGDTVVWKSKEGYKHVVKSVPGQGEDFDSDELIFGASFSKRFDKEGTYDYYCPIHPWMRGRVVVSS